VKATFEYAMFVVGKRVLWKCCCNSEIATIDHRGSYTIYFCIGEGVISKGHVEAPPDDRVGNTIRKTLRHNRFQLIMEGDLALLRLHTVHAQQERYMAHCHLRHNRDGNGNRTLMGRSRERAFGVRSQT